jgi:membrane-associated phospholipid phosphatase
MFDDPILRLETWSFPSGHSSGALMIYGMLAYLLARAIPSRWIHDAIAVAAAFLIALIGLSRMYLGVHYFSDVIGGYAAGIVWLAACISGVEVVRRHFGQVALRASRPAEA